MVAKTLGIGFLAYATLGDKTVSSVEQVEEEVLTTKKDYGLNKDIIRKSKVKIIKGDAGLMTQNGKPMIINKR